MAISQKKQIVYVSAIETENKNILFHYVIVFYLKSAVSILIDVNCDVHFSFLVPELKCN